jgi:hypothetical protein
MATQQLKGLGDQAFFHFRPAAANYRTLPTGKTAISVRFLRFS